MSLETSAITAWTFMQEIPIPPDVAGLMVEGETPVAAFKTFRDSAIFTTKRLIVRDAQGITLRCPRAEPREARAIVAAYVVVGSRAGDGAGDRAGRGWPG